MQILFIALCISFLISETYIFFVYYKKPNFKSKLVNFIFNYFFTGIAAIFMIILIIGIAILKVSMSLLVLILIGFIFFLLFFIVEKEIGISTIFAIITIGITVLIFGLNIISEKKELQPQKITLNDYSKETLNDKEKVIILELDEMNGKTKSFIIQTYESEENLDFFCDSVDEYITENIEQNYIEVIKTQKTEYGLLTLFEFQKPDILESQKYILHVNPNDIMYN